MYVRAREPFVVELDGVPTVFNPEQIINDDHIAFKRYPDRFVPATPDVEEATNVPGQKRSTHR